MGGGSGSKSKKQPVLYSHLGLDNTVSETQCLPRITIHREENRINQTYKTPKNQKSENERNRMEVEVDEKELKAAGAEPLPDGRRGLRIHGWEIETRKLSILTSSNLQLSVSLSLTLSN